MENKRSAVKKLLVLLLALLPVTFVSAEVDDERPISFEQLPVASREFIKKHFPEAKMAFATVEGRLWPSYDVIFTDGTKMEFDSDGQWKDIDCKYSYVPEAVMLPKIVEFYKQIYPEARVKEIERDRSGYELRLDNRMELHFDLRGNFRGYDD